MSPNSSHNDLSAQIQALLFIEGGPIAKKRLAQILHVSPSMVSDACTALRARLEGSGLALIETIDEAALAVAPAATETVEKVLEKELGRDIGDAGLEVLAIILYRGPSTRSHIDYIRGVNTSSTIRTLASRGLLERTANPHDAREYLYKPTAELLAHLGVTHGEELPEYAKITSELAAFEASASPFDNHADTTTDSGISQ